jgi:hypothetical protein
MRGYLNCGADVRWSSPTEQGSKVRCGTHGVRNKVQDQGF